MAPRQSRGDAHGSSVKREMTNILPTPEPSMSSPGTISPKQEDGDDSDVEIVWSNSLKVESFQSNGNLSTHDPSPITISSSQNSTTTRAPTVASRVSIPPFAATRPSVVPTMAPSGIHRIPGAGLELIGEKVNLLVDAIEALRSLGIDEIATELPELVLVGDQSAGKSSLMSAIAEINLPKDDGMCTRCPANIKTSPADTWSCTVSLHQSYRFIKDARLIPTKKNQFPPWVESGLVIHTFKKIYDKSELEGVLRCAQLALINPSTDFRSFIPGVGGQVMNDGHHEADYSPNVVHIAISGPLLPALSFYDLPGVFMRAQSDDQGYLVKVFENLAEKYIRHENALIICAITMQNDPGLSKTSALIKDWGASRRTIGVLTMPDRLPDGAKGHEYDRILRKEAHIWPRGYFCTKQPGPSFKLAVGNDYHSQARQEEMEFFDTDHRWSGEWSDFRERCGTRAIQTYLSREFAILIANSMPKIDELIRRKAADVDRALESLPELPNENVQHIVRQCLQIFSNNVQNILEPGRGSLSLDFQSSWSEMSHQFKDAVQKMKPMFGYHDPPEIISIDDSDTESIQSSPAAQHLKRPSPYDIISPNKRSRYNDTPVPYTKQLPSTPPTKQEKIATPGIFSKPPVSQFAEFWNAGKGFSDIVKVRAIIRKHRTPGHPDNVTDTAREVICLQSTKAWNGPLERLEEITFKLLRQHVLGVLLSALGDYKQTELYRQSKRHVLEFLDMHRKDQHTALAKCYELESYKLFTLNDEAFLRYREEELAILSEARRKHRAQCAVAKNAKLNGKNLTEKERQSLERNTSSESLGPDPFALEVATAAYVRGYYRTACQRFIDNACQSILGTLFRKVHSEIPQLLEGLLGLNTGDSEATCRSLLVEGQKDAQLRANWLIEKKKLAEAKHRIEQLVEELDITPEDAAVDSSAMDEDDDEEVLPAYRRSASIPSRQRTVPLDDEDVY